MTLLQQFFSMKNNTQLQLLDYELQSISQQSNFNKKKSLYRKIFGLDPTAAISESRMKRIIIHSLRPEF